MNRDCQLTSAAVAAWLALFSTAFADAPAAPAAQLPEPTVLEPAPNAVFLEALGPAIAYSVNYERILLGQVAVRVGIAPWLGATHDAVNFAVPITLTYVGLDRLEAGGGITFLNDRSPMASVLVGYRLHPRGGAGFQFRVGGMVLVGEQLTHFGDVAPWLYLSVGAGF